MRRTTSWLLLLLLTSGPAPAALALSEWRTEVQVTVGSGTGTQFAFDGGLNQASSFQEISTLGGSGMSEAAASLGTTGFVPTLQVRAIDAGTDAQAVAWGVQGYTNASASPLSTTFVMSLTGDITGANDLFASLYLFQDEGFEYFRDPGTVLFESSSQLWPGFEDFANNLGPTGFDISVANTAGPVDQTRSFDFTVDPGDSFYVYGRVVANADQLGEVDAFGSLTASFSDTMGLVPAAVVPEPGTAALLAPGLLGLAGLRRRAVRLAHSRHQLSTGCDDEPVVSGNGPTGS